jgi:hypothetical protein
MADDTKRLIDPNKEQVNLSGLLTDSNLTSFDILYDLYKPELSSLSRLDGERQLLFSLGAEEMEATITESGEVSFENTDHISMLSGNDLIYLRFFQNSDTANVLWEIGSNILDVDVDSDNNGSGIPDRTANEDKVEFIKDNPEKPGLVIITKLFDSDKEEGDDQLPDYCDYIISDSSKYLTEFMQLVVDLGDEDISPNMQIQLDYSASDPNKLMKFGDDATGYQYIPAPGQLRIWAKQANITRNPDSVLDGGDWVISGEPIQITKLPEIKGGQIILYIESVALSIKPGDQAIKTTIIKNK